MSYFTFIGWQGIVNQNVESPFLLRLNPDFTFQLLNYRLADRKPNPVPCLKLFNFTKRLNMLVLRLLTDSHTRIHYVDIRYHHRSKR